MTWHDYNVQLKELGTRIGLEELCPLVYDALQGLKTLHHLKVQHRDIKRVYYAIILLLL